MSQVGYMILAISILVALAAVSLVGYVLYRRMPAPQGCEDLHIGEGKCGACSSQDCPMYARFHKEEE